MALLIAVAVTTVLVAVSVELHRRAYVAATVAAANRNRVTLNQMATSGIHAALAILIKDKQASKFDSLQEDWAQKEKIAAILSAMGFDKGQISVKISDELSRIQVNALVVHPGGHLYLKSQKIIWERLLDRLRLKLELEEEVQATAIMDAIKDWLDSGDDDAVSGLNGAESDFYQNLDPPYACANGPIQHVSELALIKGISSGLFNGTETAAGLKALVSIHGIEPDPAKRFAYKGRININTADLPVLRVLLPPDRAEMATVMVDYRLAADAGAYINDLSQPTWYKNVVGLKDLDIDPALITTQSDIYRIESTAHLRLFSQRIIAVVQRKDVFQNSQNQYKVLRWIVKYNIGD